MMAKLEKTLEKVELKEDKSPVEKPIYQGFKLVEEKVYAAGTSIKYWM